jgi:uncharacterized damage-inducible protein DinB
MNDQLPMPGWRDLLLGDLDAELQTTRRLLERVPDEQLGWKPHPRSWSLGELASHLANLLFWMRITVERAEFDLEEQPERREAVPNREALLRLWDENAATLGAALASMSDSAVAAEWSLLRGGRTMLRRPRWFLLRTMAISHVVHPRGQLSVYLRLLDVPVPPIYGPSADEAPGGG